jgi:hypothetical protein
MSQNAAIHRVSILIVMKAAIVEMDRSTKNVESLTQMVDALYAQVGAIIQSSLIVIT